MSKTNKSILLNAFNMNCAGHINHGLRTHPRDRSTDYRLLPYQAEPRAQARAQAVRRTLSRGHRRHI